MQEWFCIYIQVQFVGNKLTYLRKKNSNPCQDPIVPAAAQPLNRLKLKNCCAQVYCCLVGHAFVFRNEMNGEETFSEAFSYSTNEHNILILRNPMARYHVYETAPLIFVLNSPRRLAVKFILLFSSLPNLNLSREQLTLFQSKYLLQYSVSHTFCTTKCLLKGTNYVFVTTFIPARFRVPVVSLSITLSTLFPNTLTCVTRVLKYSTLK